MQRHTTTKLSRDLKVCGGEQNELTQRTTEDILCIKIGNKLFWIRTESRSSLKNVIRLKENFITQCMIKNQKVLKDKMKISHHFYKAYKERQLEIPGKTLPDFTLHYEGTIIKIA